MKNYVIQCKVCIYQLSTTDKECQWCPEKQKADMARRNISEMYRPEVRTPVEYTN